MSAHNPEVHHRRSIRLQGHDYAGDGLYFITICAHREFIRFAHGHPFGRIGAKCELPGEERATCVSPGGKRATCVSPVRIIAEEWERCGEVRDDVFPDEFVVMPDHFHGLIRIEKGQSELGHVIGAFKAAASRRIRHRRGDTHVALNTHVAFNTHVAKTYFAPPPKNVRIWHRNYYEMIVCTPEAEQNVREYIRMNPWKLIQHAKQDGQPYRMIGNPTLLDRETIAMLCSRKCPPDILRAAQARVKSAGPEICIISGFHSPPEKTLLTTLLASEARIICCPAWGIDTMKIPSSWLPALEANRMLILEMRDRAGNLAAAEKRNRFVLARADRRWIPYASPGGMLQRLLS